MTHAAAGMGPWGGGGDRSQTGHDGSPRWPTFAGSLRHAGPMLARSLLVVASVLALVVLVIVTGAGWSAVASRPVEPEPTWLCASESSPVAEATLVPDTVARLSLTREEACGYFECEPADERWTVLRAQVSVTRERKEQCTLDVGLTRHGGDLCALISVEQREAGPWVVVGGTWCRDAP